MTKFYTGTGDKGKSVFGKIILPKSDSVFEAIGSLDELNAVIGFCRVEVEKNRSMDGKKIAEILFEIQETFFLIQAEIASARFKFDIPRRMDSREVVSLEKIIEELSKKLPEINKFQIPGGSELSARLNIARTIARRAERAVVSFNQKKISSELVRYLNRLSSLLFVMSRYVNYCLKIKETSPKY